MERLIIKKWLNIDMEVNVEVAKSEELTIGKTSV